MKFPLFTSLVVVIVLNIFAIDSGIIDLNYIYIYPLTFEAGFVLWICSICVACVVFICEHILRYNSKRRKKAYKVRDTKTFYAQLMDEKVV